MQRDVFWGTPASMRIMPVPQAKSIIVIIWQNNKGEAVKLRLNGYTLKGMWLIKSESKQTSAFDFQ